MPFAEEFFLSGVTTAAQTATLPAVININTGFLPTKVRIINATQYGQTATGNLNLQTIDWNSNLPGTSFTSYINAAGTATLPGAVTTNGISLYDGTRSVLLGAVVTGGALSKANPAVLTSTAHGLQTGDQIIIHGPFTAATAMNQLGGLVFTVTVTGANTVTIPINTNTANFTATTVTTWQKVRVGPLFYPQRTAITGITAANPIVVSTATNHGFTVGQQIRLEVPRVFGMVEANNLSGVITAVTATTFTIGSIDASAFTAFAWPAVTSLPFTHAYAIPIGSGPSPTTVGLVTFNQDLLDDATTNQQFQGFTIGSGLLQTSSAAVIGVTASDILIWEAWRASV
jgi:hypothetical protein